VLSYESPYSIVTQLCTDSRKVISASETLFFSLKGKRLKGDDFIDVVYNLGVRNFIVEEKIDVLKYPEANIYLVSKGIVALQELVAAHRKSFKIPVIGVTGSNGKTIVKEWLYQLLQPSFNIVRSPKSYNSQLGVPLSVWKMDSTHTLGIFEAGISEMEKLENIIAPTIGVITNIGEAHDEGFLNQKQKIREKLNLFKHSHIIIYCFDHNDIQANLLEVQHNLNEYGKLDKFKTLSWGKNNGADIQISSVNSANDTTQIEAKYKEKTYAFSIPFIDKAAIENALHCFAVMLYLGIESKDIAKRISSITPIEMRLELKEGINNNIIINDAYNSDINALKIAIDFLNQQSVQNQKVLILSDILQSGRNESDLYSEVVNIINQNKIHKVYCIGEQMMMNKSVFKGEMLQSYFYKTTEQFIQEIDIDEFKNQTILIKGARPFSFERISKLLEKKAHETVLEISLNAISHNLNIYHSMLKPSTKIMVMIKAFAYGGGSFEIAKLLQHQKVDCLGVAYIDEGVELRKEGITMPILVLNPEISNFDLLLKYNLEPEIYSHYILDKYLSAISENLSKDQIFPIHIKLDTGMHRLGFEEAEIPKLNAVLSQNDKIKVVSIFSHLASADNDQHDNHTSNQIELFDKMSADISKNLGYQPMRHILNSAGIARFKSAQYEMVRLGIGLYGIDSSEKIQDMLECVATLKTTISQIKNIKKGDAISYNRMTIAEKDMRSATVSIGYADGLNRKLSNRNGYMIINGQVAPIIGNVCMDMTMLDITNITDVKEGDKVIVFGKELSVNILSELTGTIPYEVMTGISQRVKRVYFLD
jgi:Alr-MurF fusion protein